jgi:hypothetical protein
MASDWRRIRQAAKQYIAGLASLSQSSLRASSSSKHRRPAWLAAAPRGTWHAFFPLGVSSSLSPRGPEPHRLSPSPSLSRLWHLPPVLLPRRRPPITAPCRLPPPGSSSLLQQDQQVHREEQQLDPRRYVLVPRLPCPPVVLSLISPESVRGFPRAVCKDHLRRLPPNYPGFRRSALDRVGSRILMICFSPIESGIRSCSCGFSISTKSPFVHALVTLAVLATGVRLGLAAGFCYAYGVLDR